MQFNQKLALARSCPPKSELRRQWKVLIVITIVVIPSKVIIFKSYRKKEILQITIMSIVWVSYSEQAAFMSEFDLHWVETFYISLRLKAYLGRRASILTKKANRDGESRHRLSLTIQIQFLMKLKLNFWWNAIGSILSLASLLVGGMNPFSMICFLHSIITLTKDSKDRE